MALAGHSCFGSLNHFGPTRSLGGRFLMIAGSAAFARIVAHNPTVSQPSGMLLTSSRCEVPEHRCSDPRAPLASTTKRGTVKSRCDADNWSAAAWRLLVKSRTYLALGLPPYRLQYRQRMASFPYERPLPFRQGSRLALRHLLYQRAPFLLLARAISVHR
jgi:hypothetical protein